MSDDQVTLVSGEAQEALYEALVQAYETGGLSPIAGRIIGALLIAREDDLSSDDLADAIGASKGAISTQTQFLVERGLIDRSRRPGSRKTWYSLKPRTFLDLLQRHAEKAQHFEGLCAAALEEQRAGGDEPSVRMKEFLVVNRFFAERLPALIEEFRAYRAEILGED